MGLLLVGLGVIETGLYLSRRPLLSHQRGWKRVAVLTAGAVLVAHVAYEGARLEAAERAAREWRW